MQALRQAIASRSGYTFQGALPKEFMLEQASERNRISLPRVERGYGLQLPPEKYCLTGTGWGLREEWSDEESLPDTNGVAPVAHAPAMQDDERMGGMDGVMEDEDEDEGGRMEDVFGEEGGGNTGMDEA